MDRFRDIDPGMPGKAGGYSGGNFPPRRGGSAPGAGDGEAFGGRIPPQNIEAEIAVLGAMMLGERGSVERAAELIERGDFYREAHGLIYDAMLTLAEKDEPVDIVTLKDELGRRGALDNVGGIAYLMQLGDFVPTTANLSYHAQIVREKAILRRLIEAASRIAGMAYGEVDEVDTIVDMAERTIFEVARKRSAQGFMPLRPLLNEAFEQVDVAYHEKGMVTGIDTGFEDFNYMTSGLQDGDLVIIAARPSMGKCLKSDSRVVDPTTGERLTIREAVERKQPTVLRVGDDGKVGVAPVSAWVDSGVKPCWRVATDSGRCVEVTGHHPFLTAKGWVPLHDLRTGDQIGLPRRLSAFGADDSYSVEEARLLGYFLAFGEFTHTAPQVLHLTDYAIRSDFRRVLKHCFPRFVLGELTQWCGYTIGSSSPDDPNECTTWLIRIGLWRKPKKQKAFPPFVWMWTKAKLCELLSVLFSCRGSGSFNGVIRSISFNIDSEDTARDVQHALTRFGIVSRLTTDHPRHSFIEIDEPEDIATFQREIGWIGETATRIDRLAPLDIGTSSFQPTPASDIYWDEIVSIEPIGDHPVYDLCVPDGANFVAQDIFVHNTSLAVGIGQNVALQKERKTVALFSLEMSREQLVQRMICSEARVDAHKLRTGFLQDDDWDRLAGAIQRLWDANIFIDDTTDMGPLEMRAKCRRLRAEHGLDLVIVDYLQLMRGSGRMNSNRNEEITEISRGLKNIAREMKVPVIALAQLSRAVERREDKRPMLSDLRDCVTGDTRLHCADTGRLVPIAEVRPGNRVLAVDARTQKMVGATVSDWWDKGVQTVYRVTTETGRVLEATANHPFLTSDGYKPLCELDVDELVATARCLPHSPEKAERGDLCRLLGYMVGDGHYGKHRTVSFISADLDVYEDAKRIARTSFPEISFYEAITPSKTPCYEVDFVCYHKEGKYGKPFGNPLLNWFRQLGILGQLCDAKRVPSFVWEAGEAGAREYLAGYLATDGCVKQMRGKYYVHFDTVGFELARDVQHLLLRIGVVATIQGPARKDAAARVIYRINVNPQDENLRRFARLVQPIGRKGVLLETYLATATREATNPGVFALPAKLSLLLFERTKHRRQQGKKLLSSKRLYWKNQGKRLRRDMCQAWADRLGDAELSLWANSDLLWERVRSVEPVGEKPTYDIRVPATGNFLAEGVVIHNSGSIEAEADLVSFIYRPAYYERKQEVRAGDDEKADEQRGGGDYEGEEAEVIIAKHRNGPTGTVKVAFLARFARFDNLTQRDDVPNF